MQENNHQRKSVQSPHHGTSTSSGKTNSSLHLIEGQSRAVWIFRLVFLAILALVAALLGYFAFKFTSQAEEDLVEAEYESLIDRAIDTTRLVAKNKLLGTITMAQVAAYSVPDPNQWPNVIVDGFYDIAATVVPTSIIGGMSLAPLILPDQVVAFEEAAYRHYEDQFPDDHDVATSDFGRGIWAKNATVAPEAPDAKFHDITGDTPWGSPYQILVPKLQHSRGNHPGLLMNVHYFEQQGRAVDAAINCSQHRQVNCSSVSDMVPPKDSRKIGPGAFVVTPVYPSGELKGFIFAKMNWIQVVQNIFAERVCGIDIVIETLSGTYSYTVRYGESIFVGAGDHHDPKYDDFGRSEILFEEGTLSEDSVSYTVRFYPNDAFYDLYTTPNPVVAAVGTILIILFTSAVFVLYDSCVRKEFSAKKELLRARRRFVRYVSHEVRTPLNSVCMAVALLQDSICQSMGYRSTTDAINALEGEQKMSKEQKWLQLTQEVYTNAENSVTVLNDLLHYDKIESGTLNLELNVVPIWELVENVVKEFSAAAVKKNNSLKIDLCSTEGNTSCAKAADLPLAVLEKVVIGDPVRLAQVLRNLISNSLKFTENGSLRVSATIAANSLVKASPTFAMANGESVSCVSVGEVVITVRDTGAGMSRDQVSRLFHQGVQFNVNMLQGGNGSGLGLYIARGIVKQHNGSLVAESDGLGLGTTFTLRLPLFQCPEGHSTTQSHSGMSVQSQNSNESYQLLPLNVLVVDDAMSNRKLLVRLMATRGHECDSAENGQIAVDKVREALQAGKPYDLILLDYAMPVMEGPEAVNEMRKLGCSSFVVGVTGNVMPEDIKHFESCGANAVLPKPCQMSALEDLLLEFNVGERVSTVES